MESVYLHSGYDSHNFSDSRQLISFVMREFPVEASKREYVASLLEEFIANENRSIPPELFTKLRTSLANEPRRDEPEFPERDHLYIVIPITIIYSIILITGIVGNICTCLVIMRNKYMRTVTNYYLFNLSVSDLLLLILGLPHEIYTIWYPHPYIFGMTFCRLRVLASEVSSNVSVITITAFTMERYVAICHPIRVPTQSGLSRAVRVMVAVWLVSTLCAIPIALQFHIIYPGTRGQPNPNYAQCNTLYPDQAKTIFQVSTFLFFVFPMTAITLLYSFIAVAIRRSTLQRSSSNASADVCDSHKMSVTANTSAPRHNSTSRAKARQSVLKMLVAVVVCFFVCWAPFHTERLLATYTTDSLILKKVHRVLFYVSGITYYLSATINPILYSIMSLKFRKAFRSTLHCCYYCLWAKPQRRRRVKRNLYTFKFQHRSHINIALNCGAVDSSTTTTNNTNNNNDNNHVNTNTPVLCCGEASPSSLSRPEGCSLVEMTCPRDGQRFKTYRYAEPKCVTRGNIPERML